MRVEAVFGDCASAGSATADTNIAVMTRMNILERYPTAPSTTIARRLAHPASLMTRGALNIAFPSILRSRLEGCRQERDRASMGDENQSGRLAYERRAWDDAYRALSDASGAGSLGADDVERL